MATVLYSRRGCHLCEQAEEWLGWHAPDAVTVDVDAAADLGRRFGTRVPVLEIDDRIVLEGRFDESDLVRILAAGRAGEGPARPSPPPTPRD
jgi:glutaredoxin